MIADELMTYIHMLAHNPAASHCTHFVAVFMQYKHVCIRMIEIDRKNLGIPTKTQSGSCFKTWPDSETIFIF